MTNSLEIEVFRVGAPAARDIGEDQLHQVAASYDSALDPAPIVIGAPKSEDPAHGIVEGLRVDGKRLLATIRNVSTELLDGVTSGRLFSKSVMLWPPEHPSNPTPKRWNLRHVGFLDGTKAHAALEFAAFAFSAGDHVDGPAHDGSLAAGTAEITAAARNLVNVAKARDQLVTFEEAIAAVSGEGPWPIAEELTAARQIGAQFAAVEFPAAFEPSRPEAQDISEARELMAKARAMIDAGRALTFEAAIQYLQEGRI